MTYNFKILITVILFILIGINIIYNSERNNLFNSLNLFLAFYTLNIIDYLGMFKDGNIVLKLNNVNLQTPNLSFLIVSMLNIFFMLFVFLFIPNSRVNEETTSIKYEGKKIPIIFYFIAVVPSIFIVYKLMNIIITYGVGGYIYQHRSGNWILIAISYSTIVFSIMRSVYYKKIDFFNIFALGVYIIVFPSGGAVIRYIVMSLVVYDNCIKKVSNKKLLLMFVIVVLIYPITKFVRVNYIPTLNEVLGYYDYRKIIAVITSRSTGASMQIAIVDYYNNKGGFTFFVDYFKYIFTVFIPRKYFPNKPVTYGTVLTDLFTYNYYVVGTGVAPSLLGYLYHAIGLLTFPTLFIIGKIVTSVDRIKSTHFQWKYYLLPFFYVTLYGLVDGNLDGYIFSILSTYIWVVFWYVLFSKKVIEYVD